MGPYGKPRFKKRVAEEETAIQGSWEGPSYKSRDTRESGAYESQPEKNLGKKGFMSPTVLQSILSIIQITAGLEGS